MQLILRILLKWSFAFSLFRSAIQTFGCGIISPQVLSCFDKSTTSLFFRCWFSQQLHSILPSKFFSFHSFNSYGGIALFISSSAIPSCEVHVLFLPFSVGMLPKFFYSFIFYRVLTGVVSESILFPWAFDSRHICRSYFLTEWSRLCSSSLLWPYFTSSSFSSVSFLRSRDEIPC